MKNKRSSKAKLSSPVPPHDHTPELKRLRRIKGQVEGVERMISDRRYCPEIVVQIKAVRSALKSLECSIVEGHLYHCVKAAMKSKNKDLVQTKLDEVVNMMRGQDY